MRNKRKIIIIDPSKDPLLAQTFNDISQNGQSIFEYKNKDPKKWRILSSKISNKASDLIESDPCYLYPPSTSRYREMGFTIIPNYVNVEKQEYGKKLKFIFDHKIF